MWPWISTEKYTCTSLCKQSWVSLPCPGCSGAMEQHLWSKQRWSEMSLHQKVPPHLYKTALLWRVWSQGTLEWSSQDTELFVEGSGMLCPTMALEKLPASIHSQHTDSCAQSLFFFLDFMDSPSWLPLLWYGVPLPKHSQEIEIIKIILSPAQNLMGNPSFSKRLHSERSFQSFQETKNFCSWQNFVLERKKNPVIDCLIKTLKGAMSVRRKGPGFPFFSIFWVNETPPCISDRATYQEYHVQRNGKRNLKQNQGLVFFL